MENFIWGKVILFHWYGLQYQKRVGYGEPLVGFIDSITTNVPCSVLGAVATVTVTNRFGDQEITIYSIG